MAIPGKNFIFHQLLSHDYILSSIKRNTCSILDLSKKVEITPGRPLNANKMLNRQQDKLLISLIQKHKTTFVCDYGDMHGIHPRLCTHRIYIKEYCKLIRKP